VVIYTIGHSTLSIDEFLAVVRGLDRVVDIRSHPTSKWEQFRAENLELHLAGADIKYTWLPGLGGWTAKHYLTCGDWAARRGVDLAVYSKGKFPKQRIAQKRDVKPDEPVWTNQGLYDYSWFMTTPEFAYAADRLVQMGRDENVGILCAEVLWWKCHRSMVADYLVATGHDAVHLQPRRTVHSSAIGNRLERYEPAIRHAWRHP
jgi:uncharacterized protein (DUF488 family)